MSSINCSESEILAKIASGNVDLFKKEMKRLRYRLTTTRTINKPAQLKVLHFFNKIIKG
jgi:hypothetical protein